MEKSRAIKIPLEFWTAFVMPKRKKGAHTKFVMSFESGDRTFISVDNHPQITKVVVYYKPKINK